MGAPVLNGGFSTLVAFILLAGSESYVFSTFFSIFLLVIIFGLYHGLILLPVLLSLIGPSPYDSEVKGDLTPVKELEIRKESGKISPTSEELSTQSINKQAAEDLKSIK